MLADNLAPINAVVSAFHEYSHALLLLCAVFAPTAVTLMVGAGVRKFFLPRPLLKK